MRTFTAVIERDPESGTLIGYVPGFTGAHSQAATIDELNLRLIEVIEMLLEDGEPDLCAEFVGVHTVRIPNHAKAAGAEATRIGPRPVTDGVC